MSKYVNALYSPEYDAYFDKHSFEWIEDKCSDPFCEFCALRPNNAEGLRFEDHGKVRVEH